MAGGNTIGRVLGQSPPSDGEPEESNPLQELMETVKTAKELADHIKELVETFKPEEEPEPGHGGHDEGDPLEALTRALTRLGERLAPTAADMEGPGRSDQAATQTLTRALVARMREVSGEPGAAVDRSALDALVADIETLLRNAPSTAQARQALDNALTATRMEGMAKPAVNALEKVKKTFEAIKGIVESAKKLAGEGRQSDGAIVRDSE